jgi:hypothetical protein
VGQVFGQAARAAAPAQGAVNGAGNGVAVSAQQTPAAVNSAANGAAAAAPGGLTGASNAAATATAPQAAAAANGPVNAAAAAAPGAVNGGNAAGPGLFNPSPGIFNANPNGVAAQGAAAVQPGVNAGGVPNTIQTAPLSVNANLQAGAAANINNGAARPDQWRYTLDNGRWWYWTPENSWMYYDGSQWTNYQQPAAGAAVTTGVVPYTSYYGGYNAPSYGYGYGYGYPNYGGYLWVGPRIRRLGLWIWRSWRAPVMEICEVVANSCGRGQLPTAAFFAREVSASQPARSGAAAGCQTKNRYEERGPDDRPDNGKRMAADIDGQDFRQIQQASKPSSQQGAD